MKWYLVITLIYLPTGEWTARSVGPFIANSPCKAYYAGEAYRKQIDETLSKLKWDKSGEILVNGVCVSTPPDVQPLGQ